MSAPRGLLASATCRLADAGVGSPRVDAELLLAFVLDESRSRLIALDTVKPEDAARYLELVERRAARVPLQHLTGRAPFRHIQLAVGPGVFVPRPETELLVDAVLPALRAEPAPSVVDLCSGSGALALAIADEVPGCRVVAVERSDGALTWLRRNAQGSPVEVVAADIADPVPPASATPSLTAGFPLASLAGSVDIVVSNPPYVPLTCEVEPEVRADPAEAVYGGSDGLSVIPDVIARAGELLRPGGTFAMEHDDTHAEAVCALLTEAARWEAIRSHRDLTGRPRFVTAMKR